TPAVMGNLDMMHRPRGQGAQGGKIAQLTQVVGAVGAPRGPFHRCLGSFQGIARRTAQRAVIIPACGAPTEGTGGGCAVRPPPPWVYSWRGRWYAIGRNITC